jgi:hypothetical protein
MLKIRKSRTWRSGADVDVRPTPDFRCEL